VIVVVVDIIIYVGMLLVVCRFLFVISVRNMIFIVFWVLFVLCERLNRFLVIYWLSWKFCVIGFGFWWLMM